MSNYRVNPEVLDNYLFFNINHPAIRSTVISDYSQDIVPFQNQAAAMSAPWEIFFDGYDPRNSFDCGDNNVHNVYIPEFRRKIVGFIIANRLRLPGEPGYQARFGGHLRMNSTNEEHVEMANAGLGRGFNVLFGSKRITVNLHSLKRDLKKLK